MSTEAEILAEVRAEASRLGAVLFRNNTGSGRSPNGRRVRFGLFVGSSDLIGWLPREGCAVFVAIEVKRPGGRTSPAQMRFLDAVRAAGGIGAVVSHPEQLAEVFGCSPTK